MGVPAAWLPAAAQLMCEGCLLPLPCALQRTFREIMFLQELNNHENIIRCGSVRGALLWPRLPAPSVLPTGGPAS